MGAKKYAQEVIKEGKRVRWPKKDIFIPTLVACIIVCVFCALVLSLWDWGAGSLVSKLKEVFSPLHGGDSTEASTSEPVVAAIKMILFK